MEIQRVLELILPGAPVSSQFADFIAGRVERQNYRKGEILVAAGMVVDRIWVIISGLAKARYYDSAGRQVITRFWKENQVVMLKGREAEEYSFVAAEDIVILETSELISISNRELKDAFANFPETDKLVRRVYFSEIRSRDLRQSLLIMEATQAYDAFCRAFPAGRIQIQDIAYYLNVRPYTLSRIRKRRN